MYGGIHIAHNFMQRQTHGDNGNDTPVETRDSVRLVVYVQRERERVAEREREPNSFNSSSAATPAAAAGAFSLFQHIT